MAFDPRAYEDEVLKPLRRLLPNLPDDLQTRYAVDPSMDAAALRERVETVVRLWNKLAMRPGHGGMVAKQLAHDHRQLEVEGVDVGTREFWQEWGARRKQTVGTAVEQLAAELRTQYGTLGVITASQLHETADLHGALAAADVAAACRKAGLHVVEPVELPTLPGMRGQLKVLNDALIEAGVQSIPELFFPGLTSFGLLDGLSVTPRPAGRTVALTAAAAGERMVELDRLPDSGRVRSERAAVGMLLTEGRTGADLAALALFHLLQPVREKQAQGVAPGTLFAQLTRTKLQHSDAGRIVVSLQAAGAGRDPATEVAALLADGRLFAAQQAAAALSDEEGEAVLASVARVHEQVAALRAAATEHLGAGREEQAGDALRQALGLARDLPGLAEQLAGVPAAPVLGVTAVADGSGVRVTWRPAPSHGTATDISVVRGRGRAPQSPDDGAAIPVTGGHATDPAPPVGTEVHYAAFARAGEGRWSRPTAATVRVVPPVSEVVVHGGTGVVTGRWQVHPAVAAVEVRRSSGSPDAPGEPVRVQRNRAFCDESVRDGVQYYYALVATYPSVSGGAVLRSVPVVVRGATRLEARPVVALTVSPVGSGGRAVRLSWRQKPGSEVALRRAGRPCPWEYGADVGRADLQSWGTELEGELTVRGESMTLVATIPPGRSWIVPFTSAPDGAVRGQDAYIELLEPVRGVAAQRFGDDVLITWVWPDHVGAAEVQWAGGSRRITVQQYRDEGGCQLRSVPGVRRVEVGAVVLGSADEARSPTISVEVETRKPQLSYELRRRGHRLMGGIRCTVTVTSPEPVPRATLVLVGSAGPVMPLSPESGIELLREAVSVAAGVPLVLPEVAVPGVLRKPFWLRCFLAEPASAQLLDPPVDQLKVS